MCTPSGPGALPPPSPAVNGTWTPAVAYTEAERAANRKRLTAENLQSDQSAMGINETMYAGNPDAFASSSGHMGETILNNRREAQVRADAAHLASIPRQEGKAAQAPGRRAPGAANGGGPTTLLTGGTAADALSVKRTRAGVPSLLGG
jgi:hypothetical protein